MSKCAWCVINDGSAEVKLSPKMDTSEKTDSASEFCSDWDMLPEIISWWLCVCRSSRFE